MTHNPRPNQTTSFEALKNEVLGQHPTVRAAYEAEKAASKVRGVLKNLRLRTGLTQGRLAEAMGVTQPVVSRIESEGSGDITLETLYRYAHACNAKLVLSFAAANELGAAVQKETKDVRVVVGRIQMQLDSLQKLRKEATDQLRGLGFLGQSLFKQHSIADEATAVAAAGVCMAVEATHQEVENKLASHSKSIGEVIVI